MRIDIQARGVTLTETLRGYVERRLYFALGRFSDRIERVAVTLEDANGPRGGVDLKSRIRVEVAHLPPLNIEDSGADLYVAIDRTADRASRTLARKLAREKDLARSGGGDPRPPKISGMDFDSLYVETGGGLPPPSWMTEVSAFLKRDTR